MRSFTAILNPASGGGAAAWRWARVRALLERDGAPAETVLSRDAGHAASSALAAAAAGRVVVAVGGDGLVRDLAGAVAEAGGVLGVVPAGRGNDLAAALGLPSGPERQARTLVHGPERSLDLLDVDGRLVPGNAYAGLDSVATALLNRSRIPTALAYTVAPLLAVVRWWPARFRVEVDGEAFDADAHLVVVANSGRYGGGLRIAPGAVPDDGLLDVVVVGAGISKLRIVPLMRQVRAGTHVRDPEVRILRGRTVRVDADRELPLCLDGDQFGHLPMTAEVRPGALRVLAP